MSEKRILDETTASVAASDDYLYIDGQTNGSRKITPENIVLNSTTAQLLAQHIEDAADDLESVQGDISDLQGDVADVKSDLGDLADLETEDTSSIVNAINEVASGSSGSGLTADIKQALLQIAGKVAYIDANGQDYYDDLYDALYSVAVVRIGAVYTQTQVVDPTTALDDLKTDLVVTAYYEDSTSTVVTNYTLSGTLAIGTSTITVTYQEFTTTFNVTVTERTFSTLYRLQNTPVTVANNTQLQEDTGLSFGALDCNALDEWTICYDCEYNISVWRVERIIDIDLTTATRTPLYMGITGAHLHNGKFCDKDIPDNGFVVDGASKCVITHTSGSDSITLYTLNNGEVTSTTVQGSYAISNSSYSGNLYLGGSASGYFSGTINDFVIYSEVIPQEAIESYFE